jgi:[protein-PII] uridylyltransferase
MGQPSTNHISESNQVVYVDTQGLFLEGLRKAFLPENQKQHIAMVKKLLEEQRERIRLGSRQAGTGKSTVRQISEMTDALLRMLLDQMELNSKPDDKLVALVAVGGYGRMELCPRSDIDLLILTSGKLSTSEQNQAETIIQNLWDYGFDVGSSVRSIKQCEEALEQDPETWTSFLNERFLGGNYNLYQKFLKLVQKPLRTRKRNSLVEQKLEEREQRTQKFGGLIQLLEPNLKEGNGCLRDVHIILWMGRIVHGCRDFEDLVRQGLLTPQDMEDVHAGYNFLLRARCCLHYVTGKKDDFLAMHLQTDVAHEFGFHNEKDRKSVEVFLHLFYRHTKAINRIAESFLSRWSSRKKRSGLDVIKKHPEFKAKDGILDLNSQSGNPFYNNIPTILRYFDVANQTGLSFGNHAQLRLKQAIQNIDRAQFDAKEYIRPFLSLCQRPEKVGRMMRFMHDVGFIELLIPDFSLVRCHAQHNAYHIYTTDEHTLSVVRQLAYLKNSKDESLQSLVDALSQVDDMDLLTLACIFHDIGKGVPGDHSVTGAAMVEKYMIGMDFSREQAEEAALLVYHHLAMNEVAQRRNLEDPQTIQDFVEKVKTPETLHKLYVLTYCDTSSVHPDAWSGWKASLLQLLYHKALDFMVSSKLKQQNFEEEKERLLQDLTKDFEEKEIVSHISMMPRIYLSSTSNKEIRSHLSMIQKINQSYDKKLAVEISKYSTHVQMSVVSADRPSLLMAITAALVHTNLSLSTARIYTRVDGVVLDSFHLAENSLDSYSIKSLTTTLEARIEGNLSMTPSELHESVQSKLDQRNKLARKENLSATHIPYNVNFSNEVSETLSTFEVSCPDQEGLMYLVARVFSEMDIQIHGATLATEAGVAIDAFYVTNSENQKLESPEIIEALQIKLQEELIDSVIA